MDNYIETDALIKMIKDSVIGRSSTYWNGFVRVKDLIKIADMIKNGEIDKFGNEVINESR